MSDAHLVPVVMPQMGESLSEGTIVRWLKQPGDRVGPDEPLFELSTDKVDTDVPSPAAGTLAKIIAQEGDTVAVGEAVAYIEPEQTARAARAVVEEPRAAPEESGGHFKSTHAPQLVSFRRDGSTPVPTPSTSVPTSTSVPQTAVAAATPVPARPATSVPSRSTPVPNLANRSFSPAVIADAQRAGLTLGQLTQMSGTGRGGRVTKADVRRFIESGVSQIGAAPAASPPQGQAAARRTTAGPPAEFIYRPAEGDRVIPMSTVRKRIARHMRWSVRISPHASAGSEADMGAVSAVMERRDAFRAQCGVPLTYTVFGAAAAVRALREFPVLNASVVGDQIVLKPAVHLGIAVALPDTDDLIVPVVRRADELSLVGLARAVHDVASRARARQLRPEDVQGGTFTLTNPGIFGGITGTPILNQPQVAILSLGAVRKQAVVIDDEVVVRPMMALALTFDHRASDGMVAFRFLARVRELLETLPGEWEWTP